MLGKLKGLSGSITSRRDAKQTGQHVVGLDIGTEYVKALVARVDNDSIEVIGVGRAHQELSDMQAGAIADITAVVQNCENALAQAEQQAGVSARSAVIGIAGELVKGKSITVTCLRQSPEQPLDIPEIEQIITLVQQRAAEKAKKLLQVEMGGKDVEIRLVNSALVSIEIDGYPVTNPVGFQGKNVTVQLYTAFAPMIHIGALEKTAQELDLDLLAVAAEPFAVTRSILGNDPNQNKSAILMDVGGGTTDIAVVYEGGVQGTEMFGIGGRAFTRAIERDQGVEFVDAERMKLQLDSPHLPEHTAASIRVAIERTLDVWLSGVALALEDFAELDHLPNQLLLCGGGASLHPLVDRLKADDWYRDLAFTKRPVIRHIDPRNVYNIADATGDVQDHTYITALGLLRVGLDTLQQQGGDTSGTIRQKLDRMLRV